MFSLLKIRKTTAKYPLLLMLVTFSFSCSTKIPVADTIPPEIIFAVMGPGVNVNFHNQAEADRIEISLQIGQAYAISCIVTDAGGVSNNSVQIFRYSHLTLEPFINLNGEAVTESPGSGGLDFFHDFVTLGNASSPTTALRIKGGVKFGKGSLTGLGIPIRLAGTDFGGLTATHNETVMIIYLHCAATGGVRDL